MSIRLTAAASLLLLGAGTAQAGTLSDSGDKGATLDSLAAPNAGAAERPDCQHAGRVDARRVRDDDCDPQSVDDNATAAARLVPDTQKVVPDALKDLSQHADPTETPRRAKDADSGDGNDAPVILPRSED